MRLFGLATFKELQEVEEDAFDRHNRNSKKLNENLEEIVKNRQSIRYLKDEISKLRRGTKNRWKDWKTDKKSGVTYA